MAHVVAAGNLPDWLAPVAVLERFSEGGTGPFVVIDGTVGGVRLLVARQTAKVTVQLLKRNAASSMVIQ